MPDETRATNDPMKSRFDRCSALIEEWQMLGRLTTSDIEFRDELETKLGSQAGVDKARL